MILKNTLFVFCGHSVKSIESLALDVKNSAWKLLVRHCEMIDRRNAVAASISASKIAVLGGVDYRTHWKDFERYKFQRDGFIFNAADNSVTQILRSEDNLRFRSFD